MQNHHEVLPTDYCGPGDTFLENNVYQKCADVKLKVLNYFNLQKVNQWSFNKSICNFQCFQIDFHWMRPVFDLNNCSQKPMNVH